MSEKKLNVGLFLDTFYPMVDGVIMVVDNYARRLSEFCNVTVFTVKPRGYKKCSKTFPYKVVQCKKMIVPFLDYDLPTPKSDRKFMKELNHADLDIVHIHSPFTIGNAGIHYAKKHGIPVIATLHSQFKKDFYRATHSKLITRSLLNGIVKKFDECDEFYAVNQNLADLFYHDYGVDHLPKVQKNGTDMLPVKDREAAAAMVNRTFGIEEDTRVFLFVGRINKLKNIHFLLEALKYVKGNFKMIFVGEGQDLHEFKRKVASNKMDDKILFTGKISDRELLTALYARAKLFLFPSLYDASSLVQIEAASQHTPTVFLRGSVTSGTITDNVNGFLSENSPSAFAEKVDMICADDELYKKVSEGAFRDLYITWDECVREMMEKYSENICRHDRTK